MTEAARPAPGLLVSVRSAAEAATALAGGADLIDVKEPSRGPLGRPTMPSFVPSLPSSAVVGRSARPSANSMNNRGRRT